MRNKDIEASEENELISKNKDNNNNKIGKDGDKRILTTEEEINKQDEDIDFLRNHVQTIGNLSKQIQSSLVLQASYVDSILFIFLLDFSFLSRFVKILFYNLEKRKILK